MIKESYIYSRTYRWTPHELNFNRIEIESNLEASQGGNYSVVPDYK